MACAPTQVRAVRVVCRKQHKKGYLRHSPKCMQHRTSLPLTWDSVILLRAVPDSARISFSLAPKITKEMIQGVYVRLFKAKVGCQCAKRM